MVETAIVIPVMVFVVLGALQLMLLFHAQVLTEYSAYNAARAGIVHNANWNVMRNAAMVGALPLYERTDTPENLVRAWGKIKVLAEATELVDTASATLEGVVDDLLGTSVAGFLPDISLVEVDVLHPNEADFDKASVWQQTQRERSESIDGMQGALKYPVGEIDFDDRQMLQQHPELGRLALETRVLVPLRIPIVNWIFFQLWYAKEALRFSTLGGGVSQWSGFQAEVEGGAYAGQSLEELVQSVEGTQVFEQALLTSQRTKEARLLRDLALARGVYLLPLRASYAMQMQSNPYRRNRREPRWFSFGGTP